jgi:protein-S-isoprenylcysteine O-methyltransferase Ste14
MKTNILSSIFLIVALAVLALQFRDQPWPPLRIAGAAIALASLCLILAARIQLGRAFSIRAKATRLVTTGLYARLRNPIYVFGCFFFLGIAMFIPFWPLLLVLIIVIPMQIARARREAAVLEASFGEEYRRYRRQTWL